MISHPKNELFDPSTLKKLGTVDEVCSLGWEISSSLVSHPREELLVLIKWNAGVAVPGMNRDTTRAHLVHPFRHNRRSTSLDFQTNAGAHKHSPCRQRLLWRSSSSLPFLSPPFGRDSRGAIAIFLWLLVPVVFAACCASNWSQIWDFSVFFGGQNWQFFCLRLFLLLVCLFVCLCGELFTVVVFVWVRRESFCVLLQQSGFLSLFRDCVFEFTKVFLVAFLLVLLLHCLCVSFVFLDSRG